MDLVIAACIGMSWTYTAELLKNEQVDMSKMKTVLATSKATVVITGGDDGSISTINSPHART